MSMNEWIVQFGAVFVKLEERERERKNKKKDGLVKWEIQKKTIMWHRPTSSQKGYF